VELELEMEIRDWGNGEMEPGCDVTVANIGKAPAGGAGRSRCNGFWAAWLEPWRFEG
jgi:hypothetical protein